MQDHFFSLEPGVIEQILPLGDSIIGAFVTLLTAGATYAIGRARRNAELDNLKAEKRSIEAASGVSTAEAAQVISEAAAATVQPLLDRIREQRQELKYYVDRNTYYLQELDKVRAELARVQAHNELMKRKFFLQGETIPELPKE